jgi:putative membrane protein insertion efficiency factor
MNQRLEKGMQRWQDIGSLLWRLPRYLLIGLVRFYQLVLSPHFPATCRYTPSCSQYAIEAFEKYGAVRGMLLTFWRLVRCHPWGGQGYDPPRWFGEPLPQSPENADP